MHLGCSSVTLQARRSAGQVWSNTKSVHGRGVEGRERKVGGAGGWPRTAPVHGGLEVVQEAPPHLVSGWGELLHCRTAHAKREQGLAERQVELEG